MSDDAAVRTMASTYWWGIPTLLAAGHDPDPHNCDIALVGVPHSSGNGSTERDQHLGPRAVRHVSAGYRRRHRRFGIVPHELSPTAATVSDAFPFAPSAHVFSDVLFVSAPLGGLTSGLAHLALLALIFGGAARLAARRLA